MRTARACVAEVDRGRSSCVGQFPGASGGAIEQQFTQRTAVSALGAGPKGSQCSRGRHSHLFDPSSVHQASSQGPLKLVWGRSFRKKRHMAAPRVIGRSNLHTVAAVSCGGLDEGAQGKLALTMFAG